VQTGWIILNLSFATLLLLLVVTLVVRGIVALVHVVRANA